MLVKLLLKTMAVALVLGGTSAAGQAGKVDSSQATAFMVRSNCSRR